MDKTGKKEIGPIWDKTGKKDIPTWLVQDFGQDMGPGWYHGRDTPKGTRQNLGQWTYWHPTFGRLPSPMGPMDKN